MWDAVTALFSVAWYTTLHFKTGVMDSIPPIVGPDIDCEGRAFFARRYYGPECADIRADVVISRHVIEHVPDPVALLKTVRLALVGSPHARVYFETPDVTWILKNRVIWDLFYEHCSLFTPDFALDRL